MEGGKHELLVALKKMQREKKKKNVTHCRSRCQDIVVARRGVGGGDCKQNTKHPKKKEKKRDYHRWWCCGIAVTWRGWAMGRPAGAGASTFFA